MLALLDDHLAPRLLGRDPMALEAIWKDLFFHTHATAVGAITSLALAALDTALWDWRARSLVGESLYHPSSFREYLANAACSIVQADVARIGGITPWLKVAHLAETLNAPINPHFLMELHVSLCAGVPNARWVEFIPQLDEITTSRVRIENGHAVAPESAGLGIEWDWVAIVRRQKASLVLAAGS